jgi:Bax protein
MKLQSIRPALGRGRLYAFPVAWAAVLIAGIGLREPVQAIDLSTQLTFTTDSDAPVALETPQIFLAMESDPTLALVGSQELGEPERPAPVTSRDFVGFVGAHGRFAAPGNALRRQVELRPVNPRTADELASTFRDVAYTLTDVRQGEAVPALRVERVPDDLGMKDGNERKLLFITALLPIILDVNQHVLAECERLLYLRDVIATVPDLVTNQEYAWLADLADRYDTTSDQMEELINRVDIVPPSMAIAQSGIESGWGTSFAARNGNALFGQIQTFGRHSVAVSWKPGPSMPQPFTNVAEATDAYVMNLNTHAAYAAFRNARAAMRARGEWPDGYQLIGQLLRYSERGGGYVSFVREVMRENELRDFDHARLSSH